MAAPSASPGRPSGLSPLAPAFAVLFVLSGACGLTYEVVWVRHLVQVFGVTAFAVSTVLVSFMGGMALGAALLGRTAERVRRPLRMFALLEAGVGLYALLLPTLLGLLERVHDAVHPWLGGSFLAASLVRFFLSLAVLLVPTVLMGGTLPALGQGLLRRRERVGLGVGLLYFVNTAGAAAGCYLAGFHLIPALGLRATTLAAAALNGGIALIAWWLDRPGGPSAIAAARPGPAPLEPRAPATEPLTSPSAWPLLVALGSGCLALMLEVVWFRVLVQVFGSTVYSFSAMLSIFLLGLAVGAVVGGWLADRMAHPVRLLALTQALVAVFALAGSLAVNRLPYAYLELLRRLGTDFTGMNATKLVLSTLALLPPGLAFGATFPAAVRAWRASGGDTGSRIGRVYAWNTVGAIVGSFAAGFLLVPGIGAEWTLAIVIGGAVLLAFGSLLAERGPLVLRWAVPMGLLLCAVGATLVAAERWDRRLLGAGVYYIRHSLIDWNDVRGSVDRIVSDFQLMTYTEGYSDTITSFESSQGKFITVNGSATASSGFSDMLSQRMMGHLPMALHPGPTRKVCIVGLGAGVTAGAIGLHELERFDALELERGVFEASRFFAAENHHVLDNPAVRVVLDDGRIHLRLTDERFDVISSHPNFPSLTGSGTLFSVEFFELVRSRLAPGGTVCHYAPLWRLYPDDLRIILASFGDVFPHVRVFNTGLSLVLLGRLEPFPELDLAELRRRLERPAVAASLREIGVRDAADLLSYYQFDERELHALTRGAPRNTENFPRVEFRAPRSVFARTVGANLERLRAVRPPVAERARRLGLFGEAQARFVERAAAYDATTEAEIAFARGDLEGGLRRLLPAADAGQRYARFLAATRAEQLGLQAVRRGDPAGARDAFALALRHEPERLESLLGLGYASLMLGRLEEAEAVLTRAATLHPDSPGPAVNLGMLRETQGRPRLAEARYREAIASRPEQARARALLGGLLLGQGRPAEALTELDAAWRLGERSEDLLVARGDALLALGRHAEALAWARRIAESLPHSERALALLAGAASSAGREDEAARANALRERLRRETAPAGDAGEPR